MSWLPVAVELRQPLLLLLILLAVPVSLWSRRSGGRGNLGNLGDVV